MKSINLSFDLFRDFQWVEQDQEILLMALELTIYRNCQWIRRRPDTPLLYESGVYYQEEPAGEEEFASIPKVLRHGSGDCDDLVSYRVAELRERFRDENARPLLVGHQTSPTYIQYHVMVQRGDGVVEDPSLILGMGDTVESIRAEVYGEVMPALDIDPQCFGGEETDFDFSSISETGDDDVPETYPEFGLWRTAA